jgi:hypothetical protein
MGELSSSQVDVGVVPHYEGYVIDQWLEGRISITGTHLLAFPRLS